MDPSTVYVGLAERKSGITVSVWYPGDYYLLDAHGVALRAAGFKVMRGCLSFARKAPFPVAALEALLGAVRASDEALAARGQAEAAEASRTASGKSR